MLIQSNRVHELFMNGLFKEEELVNGKPVVEPVVAEGVRVRIGFHPERIRQAKDEISAMIDSLDPSIDTDEGISFLNICQDKNGNLWTGLHQICDELVTMGIALELLEYVLPRDLWMLMPGGVPAVRKRIKPDPNYKDMSKYRNGRERSKIVQNWLKHYKAQFLNDLHGGSNRSAEIIRERFHLSDHTEIASAVADFVVKWLESQEGRTLVQQSFGVDIINAKSNLQQEWERMRQSTLSNVIYRTDANRETVSESIWKAVNFGSDETAEIVADTMIGWLNSPVGRSFLSEGFGVKIPPSLVTE